MIRFLFVGGWLALSPALVWYAEAQTAIESAETPARGGDIFELPALAGGLRQLREHLQHGEHREAEEVLDRLRASFPDAVILDVAGTALDEEILDPAASEALAAFAAPVAAGCPTAESVEAGGVPRGEAEPALVSENRALVTAANTYWDLRVQRLRSAFTFPPILSRKPISKDGGDPERGRLPPDALSELQDWFVRGRAAGLAGTIFDNRDRGHSGLPRSVWPQLAYTKYSATARAAGLDYGLNTEMLFDAPTLGNSSTAIVGSWLWRSQARLALTTPEGPERLFQLYAQDHVYVFPEHLDHDPLEPGKEAGRHAGRRGDLLPANTPYFLVSQGSSGSDRPFLVAVAAILAALKPEVRDFLDRHDLLAPTVQAVFRQGVSGVDGPETYMSARAHPSVFQAEEIDYVRMIRIAQDLEVDAVPPMPCVRVVEEKRPIPRVGIFADSLGEALFDTPSAIARVWRGADAERRLRVSAAETRDPNGRPLRFHWRLLRGDPKRVRIRPLGETGAEAAITVGWHERGEVPGMLGLASDRVDIAVFADNGATHSAPAFFSVLFPAHQRRVYQALPDGTQRIVEIDYADPERRKLYRDPLLFPRRDWRDQYFYDGQGQLLGWTRSREGAPEESFTRNGFRVLERDALGRPLLAEEIGYPSRRDKKGRAEVTPTPTGRLYEYLYGSEADRLGAPVPHGVGPSD